MPRFPRSRALLVVSAASAVLLSGCTSSPSVSAAPSESSGASSSSSASSTPVTSPSAGAPASPSSSAPSTSAPSTSVNAPADDAVTLDITIKDHQVSPNGEKIKVAKGQTVRVTVTSDSDDEIHAHTGGDGFELQVKAGEPAEGEFVASGAGSFEVESHHLEKIIAILVVR
jgi:FtsP/CotA-like multicopper oxidase with cupredoxin domain